MAVVVSRKNDVIQIRASAETKSVIVQAASLKGQKLSEFMLESARQKAEETLLDQRLFFLNSADHEAFLTLLDKGESISAEAKKRLSRKPVWAQ